MVHSVTADSAILTDLAGGVIQVALTSLHPDQVDSPTANAPDRPTADHRTDLA
jgi:hypothetical protein